MSDLKYHFRKCLPLVSIYLFGLFVMIWALQSNLHADTYGKTQFKTCRWCDELTYQFNPKCNNCGSTDFRDIYLKPDAEKRDKKISKEIKMSKEDEHMNQLYETYVTPLEVLIYMLSYQANSDEIAELVGDLMEIREGLIEHYKLEKYRRIEYHYPPSLQSDIS